MNEAEVERIGRVLAVELRTRWVAYAAFDAAAQLLDFGASRFRSARQAHARFLFFAELLHPTIVIFRRIPPRGRPNRPKTRKLARLMRYACNRLSLEIRLMNGRDVRNCFRMRGAKTKQQVSALLAEEYPALAWKLPPPRRSYEHEHWNMPIFDAVALGVAYFSSVNRREPIE